MPSDLSSFPFPLCSLCPFFYLFWYIIQCLQRNSTNYNVLVTSVALFFKLFISALKITNVWRNIDTLTIVPLNQINQTINYVYIYIITSIYWIFTAHFLYVLVFKSAHCKNVQILVLVNLNNIQHTVYNALKQPLSYIKSSVTDEACAMTKYFLFCHS